jgi:hypothetical protein
VCATDHNDRLASFSNYGAKNVDLCAPGVRILSTLPNNQYAFYSGTSMASPHVAGAAMLLRAKFPYLQAAQLKALLMASAEIKSNLGGISVTGGRLNIQTALTAVAPPQVFTLRNSGTSAVTLSSPVVSGTDKADFLIQSHTCNNSLAAGSQCTVTLAFAPTTAGAKQAKLEVTVNNQTLVSAEVTGNASQVSSLGASSAILNFAETANYELTTGKAILPAVVVGNQVFRVALCAAGGLKFTVCELAPSAGNIGDLGSSIYNAATGTVNIPVVKLQTANSEPENPDKINLSLQYEVEMRVFSLPNNQFGTEVTNIIPIW